MLYFKINNSYNLMESVQGKQVIPVGITEIDETRLDELISEEQRSEDARSVEKRSEEARSLESETEERVKEVLGNDDDDRYYEKAIEITETSSPSSPSTPTAPSTTMPSTTMPSTTMPSTTMPSTTMPSTTMPSTTMPSTTMPSTTMPSTTIPSTNAPFSEIMMPVSTESTTTMLATIMPVVKSKSKNKKMGNKKSKLLAQKKEIVATATDGNAINYTLAKNEDFIPGIPNTYLYYGIAIILLVVLFKLLHSKFMVTNNIITPTQ